MFWDQSHSIYANDRHLQVHYQLVARCINAHISSPSQTVLDFGCGDALCADQVAAQCQHLYLFETAVQKRQVLGQRFAQVHNMDVLGEAQLAALPAGSLDRVIINSVLQYLSPDQAKSSLTQLKEKLAPGGQIIVADIVNPASGMKEDVVALLRFAWKSGFFVAAVVSLFRTLFSSYTLVRKRLGLTMYTEPEFLGLAQSQGYQVTRIWPNFGHNPSRMTFRLTLT